MDNDDSEILQAQSSPYPMHAVLQSEGILQETGLFGQESGNFL